MDPTKIVSIVVALAALITAAGVVWKFARFVFKVDRALPTLLNIAHQFENNGGSTIKDKIDSMHNKVEELETADRIALRIAEDGRTIAKSNVAIVNELTATQAADITHIREYIHETNHGLRNEMQKQLYAQMQQNQEIAVINSRLKDGGDRMGRIEELLQAMLPLVSRHREDDAK